jgi:hypothetical protein
MPEGERPKPWLAYWRGVHLQDAADYDAIDKHVEVIVVPLAGWAARQGVGRWSAKRR